MGWNALLKVHRKGSLQPAEGNDMSTLSAPFSLKNDKGFSLVELMIVVAIIGVLAALAVPKFQSFQAKAKQSEAKSNLSHIFTLEQSYFGDQDNYAPLALTPAVGAVPVNEIGFDIQGHRRYRYSVLGGATFTATAVATSATVISSGCTFIDTWTMTQTKVLTLVNDCVTNREGINQPM